MSGAFAGSVAENIAVLAVNQAAASSTPLNTTAVPVKNFGKGAFILHTGDMASETIDFKLQGCDSGGANAVDITGRAITQVAANATTNDTKQWGIGWSEEDLIASGKDHIRGVVTTGAGVGGTVTVIALGVLFNGPAAGIDGATVVQLVP